MRGKATANHWANDSVYVQFDRSVDQAAVPRFRIGTTSAATYTLEDCSGCGVSGWGWEDDGWGARNANGMLLRFPDGGYQTIRIQIREDGVSFDQIVLSAGQYLTTRPGAAKNDTTVLRLTQEPE